MSAIINDSVGASETLLEVHNSGVKKFGINGSGSFQLSSSGTLLDSNGLNRLIINPTAKTIVDGAATTLFTVPIAQGSVIGGVINFQVYASDGTDFQVITGIATYSSVNKAGTCTNTITYATANEAKAVSAGTLTLSFTMAEDTADVISVKLQPTGSLTETTYNITYNIQPFRGVVTIA